MIPAQEGDGEGAAAPNMCDSSEDEEDQVTPCIGTEYYTKHIDTMCHSYTRAIFSSAVQGAKP